MMVGCLMLKETLLHKDEMPILSAKDKTDFLFLRLYR